MISTKRYTQSWRKVEGKVQKAKPSRGSAFELSAKGYTPNEKNERRREKEKRETHAKDSRHPDRSDPLVQRMHIRHESRQPPDVLALQRPDARPLHIEEVVVVPSEECRGYENGKVARRDGEVGEG